MLLQTLGGPSEQLDSVLGSIRRAPLANGNGDGRCDGQDQGHDDDRLHPGQV
jgi:hypothetical protein